MNPDDVIVISFGCFFYSVLEEEVLIVKFHVQRSQFRRLMFCCCLFLFMCLGSQNIFNIKENCFKLIHLSYLRQTDIL